jgi:hypothetical protein
MRVDRRTRTQPRGNAQEILQQFLAAEDERQTQRLLERLIQDCADRVIKAVIRKRMEVNLDRRPHGPGEGSKGGLRGRSTAKESELDAEDVHANSRLRLVEHLWSLKGAGTADAIQDFDAYVARIALNAFALRLRRRYPQRHHLRQKLWYLSRGATPVRGFALWQGRRPGEHLCGFRTWVDSPSTSPTTSGQPPWPSVWAVPQSAALGRSIRPAPLSTGTRGATAHGDGRRDKLQIADCRYDPTECGSASRPPHPSILPNFRERLPDRISI